MLRAVSFATAAVLFSATAAFAAKSYQVTGPVLSVSDSAIVVQKGKDKWEIARGPESNIPADIKVGDKVTINYEMTATSAEIKQASAAKPSKHSMQAKAQEAASKSPAAGKAAAHQ